MQSLVKEKAQIKSIGQCEKELADLEFTPEEIKELSAIINSIIENVLDSYFNGK